MSILVLGVELSVTGGKGEGQTSTVVPPAPPVTTPVVAPVVAPSGVTPVVGPRVEAIVSMRDKDPKSAAAVPAHKRSYEFTVKDDDWMDTGVVLGAGEVAKFTATGDVEMADGRTASADGIDRGWKDLLRQFPLNQAKVGALIGRVSDMGASVPFSIGASDEVPMPTTGKLYLRVNTSSDLTFTGSYKVKVKFSPAPKVDAKSASAVPAAAISTLIGPDVFTGIPRRVSDSTTARANPGDMVNFALVGTKEQVESAFKAAGWVAVDKSVEEAILNGLLKTLNKEAYTEMPMSTLYLFGRPQDMSFARGDPLMVAAERHHLRVWQTDRTIGGRPLWVGSATHDVGFEEDQRNGNVTHKIDPEIDKEREYLLQSFDAAGAFSSAAYVTPTNPLLEARTATGGSFHSDGRIVVMALK
ncbi:LssY C-terminal domain-containing protein [Edaphobacter aggregans]|uniref:LssY C-terminal domain-containing protein n=1 Tax=Edaphobacter aggregans TaxID=570835 RepID=UPI00068DACD8|nr:LssY C-terminal domain-containing protein [Edaphobacter aggregans]